MTIVQKYRRTSIKVYVGHVWPMVLTDKIYPDNSNLAGCEFPPENADIFTLYLLINPPPLFLYQSVLINNEFSNEEQI